jgi:rRNA maturation endonuclease Nob1
VTEQDRRHHQPPPSEHGGDPVCWLEQVCMACGRLVEPDEDGSCPACGSER